MVYELLCLLALIKRPLGAIKWSTSDEIVYGLPWLHKTSIGLIKRQIAQLALIIDRMAIGFVGLSSLKREARAVTALAPAPTT